VISAASGLAAAVSPARVAARRKATRAPRGVLTAALLVGLAGCGGRSAPDLAQIPLRNPTAVMGGTTRFDPQRFAGEWYVIADFGTQPTARKRRFDYDPASGEMTETGPPPRRYKITGPGVLSPLDPSGPDRLVVMWVDEGFRTAAIGTVSGQRGAILDRTPGGAPDRLAAAREILDFNGWDTSRLQKVDQ
jgi:apolipoprotein D and lipocalin family protein